MAATVGFFAAAGRRDLLVHQFWGEDMNFPKEQEEEPTRTWPSFAVGLLIMAAYAASAHAEPVSYELQSRCGHDAAAAVAREMQTDMDETKQAGHSEAEYKNSTSHYYENNYSSLMNGCFVLLTVHSTLRPLNIITKSLVDASTGHTLGYFTTNFDKGPSALPSEGEFNGVKYTDEKQWQAKIRPYLYNQ
jgi:hypothetical protein